MKSTDLHLGSDVLIRPPFALRPGLKGRVLALNVVADNEHDHRRQALIEIEGDPKLRAVSYQDLVSAPR